MKKVMVFAFAYLMTASLPGRASPDHNHPAPRLSPSFESLKSLVGNWEGKTQMSGKEETVQVTYELTSGGTALVEKLMPGTANEMITVYASRNGSVQVTHFCALGNQPVMNLKSAPKPGSYGKFVFEMEGTRGITDKNEMHMHALALTLTGPRLKQEWTHYKNGTPGDVAVFDFTKKN